MTFVLFITVCTIVALSSIVALIIMSFSGFRLSLRGSCHSFLDLCRELRYSWERFLLPRNMTIGDRTYEIVNLLHWWEPYVFPEDDDMVKRAVQADANLGDDDGKYILENQKDIPLEMRGKIYFVFTNWRHPHDHGQVAYLISFKKQDEWGKIWTSLSGLIWRKDTYVLRRIS